MNTRVNARARTREDRAGDPLDGLVNLFDLGIVLSVAFLLAALSSLDLTSAVFSQTPAKGGEKAPEGSVVVNPDESVKTIDLQPGQRVVGRGEPVGTVYRLDDGRTIIVRPDGTTDSTGSGSTSSGSGSSDTTPPSEELSTPPTGGTSEDETGTTPESSGGAEAPSGSDD